MNPAARLPKIVICLLLLTAITFGIFQYTVHIRKPWFGALSLKNHHEITGDAIKFTQYWYNEGPWKLKFGMFQNPPSVEFPTLDSRMPYVSYPPGSIIPIYLLSKMTGHEPTVEIVMSYNLANHFFLSLFLSWIAFFFCVFGGLPLLTSVVFSVIPIIISQFMPSLLFFYQNVYWGDQGVLPLILLFILFELFRENISGDRKSRWLFSLQAILLFLGVMTDWFFVLFAMIVYMKRLAAGEYRDSLKSFFLSSLKFWTPVMVVVGVFLLQVRALHAIPLLIQRYQERVGQAAAAKIDDISFVKIFWDGHVVQGFGFWAGWCLGAALLFLIFMILAFVIMRFSKKEASAALVNGLFLSILLLLPCLLQVYLFRNHSAVHNFSAVKLVVPLALIPCVIFPVVVWDFLRHMLWSKVHAIWVALIFLLLASAYTFTVYPGYRAFFYDNNPIFKKLGGFIARNTDYQDVVFSTKGGIDENPLYLAYSKKRVYMVRNLHQIYLFIQQLKAPYTVNLLTTADPETDQGIQKLMSAAFDVRREGALALYKIKGQ